MKRGEAGKAKLGVIIPCHNDAGYLRRCLASIKASAAPFDSRILVVIDRCTDDSLDVTMSFGVEPIGQESPHRRLVLLHKGIGGAEVSEGAVHIRDGSKAAGALPTPSLGGAREAKILRHPGLSPLSPREGPARRQ